MGISEVVITKDLQQIITYGVVVHGSAHSQVSWKEEITDKHFFCPLFMANTCIVL